MAEGRKSSFSKRGFRPSVFEEAVIKEGKLNKLSSGMIKRYQERYFTLQGHYLKYYSDSNKIQKDLKGTINLNETVPPHIKIDGLEFEVVLKDKQTAKLKAEKQEDADDWVMLLMSRLPEPLKPRGGGQTGEAELLEDDSMVLGDGEVVTMAVKELPPLVWRTFARDLVSLSEEGSVAEQTADGYCSLTTTGVELTEGKHYWEVALLSENVSEIFIGISRPNLDPRFDCTDGWRIGTDDGSLFGNGKRNDDAAGEYEQGDRVGVLLDLDDGSLRFFKNGVQHGPGYGAGSVTAPVVAAVQMLHSDHKVRLLLNEAQVKISAGEEQTGEAQVKISVQMMSGDVHVFDLGIACTIQDVKASLSTFDGGAAYTLYSADSEEPPVNSTVLADLAERDGDTSILELFAMLSNKLRCKWCARRFKPSVEKEVCLNMHSGEYIDGRTKPEDQLCLFHGVVCPYEMHWSCCGQKKVRGIGCCHRAVGIGCCHRAPGSCGTGPGHEWDAYDAALYGEEAAMAAAPLPHQHQIANTTPLESKLAAMTLALDLFRECSDY
jgi:hypothetical protein